MLKLSLCDYNDEYINVKGTIAVRNTAVACGASNNADKKVIFKNCAPFTDCISEINNAQVDNAIDIDDVMPMYNLIEYSDICSKTFGCLWQCQRDEAALSNAGDIIYFPANIAKQVMMENIMMMKVILGESLRCHYTLFYIRKPFFCLSLNFLNIMPEIRMRFS